MYLRLTISLLGLLSTLTVANTAQARCYQAGCYSNSYVSYNPYMPSRYLNIAPAVPAYQAAHHGSLRMITGVKTIGTLYQPVTQIVPMQPWRHLTNYQPVAQTVVRHGWGGSHTTIIYAPARYLASYPTFYPGLVRSNFAPAFPVPVVQYPIYPAHMVRR